MPPAFCPLRVGKGAEREAESISFQGLSVQPSSLRPCYGTLPRPPALRRAPKFFLRPARALRLPPVGTGERRAKRCLFGATSDKIPAFRQFIRRFPLSSRRAQPPHPRPHSAARQSFAPRCARPHSCCPNMSKISCYGRDFALYLFPRRLHAARAPRLPPVGTGGEEDKTLSFRRTLRQNSGFPAIYTAIPAVFPQFAAPAPVRASCFCPRAALAARLLSAECRERSGKRAESPSFQESSALSSSLRSCYGTLPRPPTFCRVPKFSPRAPAPIRAPRRGGSSCFFCVRQRNRVRLLAKRSILRANFRQSADILVTEKKKTVKRLEKKSVFVYNI